MADAALNNLEIQIVTIFSTKLQDKRANKTKKMIMKMIMELTKDD
ncbi:hypothetical protein [Tepidibacter thalassicus]